jgi:hypothetical protein
MKTKTSVGFTVLLTMDLMQRKDGNKLTISKLWKKEHEHDMF